MKPEVEKRTVKFTCADQTVDVNTTDGAKPQAVYVCEGDTVTWNPNGHTFLVEFKKDSPFADDGKKFDNGHAKSAKTKHHAQLTVYEYRITVDNHAFDPRLSAAVGPRDEWTYRWIVLIGSTASWKRRIAAIPAAPASHQEPAFSGVMPPMASTGMDTVRQTSWRSSVPCGGPNDAFDGVAKTGPKKM